VATPRFLFDEDLQGVGLLIQQARSGFGDVWVIGHNPCPIAKETADEAWLPVAAQNRLTIFRIDTDLFIRDSPAYRTWRDAGCRGFVLSTQQSKSSLWDQTRALVRQWDKIENHANDRMSDPWWIGKITANQVAPT
jgi:hypothetical protein